MSSRQGWLKRSDWQQGISSLEDRASLDVLFESLRSSVAQFDSKAEKSTAQYLEQLLSLVQGYLGCQGIGVFRRTSEWEPVVKLGGRSLGQPDADWLDEVQREDACGYRCDIPAAGWGQIACPARASIGDLQWEMLVVSGRYIREDSLASIALLVQFLEAIWQLHTFCSFWETEAAILAGLCGHFTSLLQVKTVEQLLEQLAEQSTSLLNCERATIFLHDFRSKQLIGRPATGIEGGAITVPEDAGIVGEVVREGKAIIVEDVACDSRFDNQTDQQTGFQTKTILCIPLRDETERVFGAFECLNKKAGHFTKQDESTLELLARYAAISILQTEAEQELQSRQHELQSEKSEQCQIIGESAAIKAIRSHVQNLCSNDLPVLITGETGTGKQSVAEALHYRGDRSARPFVVIDCTQWSEAAAPEMLSSFAEELIRADTGTLFLDDIDSLSLPCQQMILALLEQGTIVAAESSKTFRVDIRVTAATQARLADRILEGKFEEALFLRLNAVSIDIPPLRERTDDIEPLVVHFLELYRKQAKRQSLTCSAEAIGLLLEYSWPGNVRELKNMMERLAFAVQGDEISSDDIALFCGLETENSAHQNSEGLTEATLDFQQRYIRRAIAKARGNMTTAARLLGLHRSNLYRKMRQLKMAEAKQEQPEN